MEHFTIVWDTISFDPFQIEHVSMWRSNHICYMRIAHANPNLLHCYVHGAMPLIVLECVCVQSAHFHTIASNHFSSFTFIMRMHWFVFCCFSTEIFTQCQLNWLWQLGTVRWWNSQSSVNAKEKRHNSVKQNKAKQKKKERKKAE